MNKIESVGVVGLGFLGRGIAACLLAHGYRVVAYAQPGSDDITAYIQHAMNELVTRGGFPEALRSEWMARFEPVSDLKQLANVDFVIESVAEDAEIKGGVYDELERHLPDHVPIATNTSSLPISRLAERRRVPQRFLGMHWAEPAYATRFLELIRAEQTSDEAFQQAIELGIGVGKQPSIVQKDVPAYIVNRLGYAMYREAMHLVEAGVADVPTIDRAFRNAIGLWAAFAGPFRWIDLTGGPALYGKAMQNVLPSLSNSTQLPAFVEALMDEDARGVANRRGFYNYTDEQIKQWEHCLREAVWQVRAWTDEIVPKEEQ